MTLTLTFYATLLHLRASDPTAISWMTDSTNANLFFNSWALHYLFVYYGCFLLVLFLLKLICGRLSVNNIWLS